MTPSLPSDLFALLSSRERVHAALLIGLALIGALAEALGIGAVLPFISLLQNGEIVHQVGWLRRLYSWSGAGSIEEFALRGALVLLAIFALKNVLLALLFHLQARFASRVEARLGADLYAAYLDAPYLARLERSSADRLRIITTEVGRVTAGVLTPAMSAITEGTAAAAILALLIVVNPGAALGALALVGAASAITHYRIQRRLISHRDVRVKAIKGMFKWVSEGIGALRDAKVLRREKHFVDGYVGQADAYARATGVFNSLSAIPRLAVETAAVGALLLAVVAGIAAGTPMQETVPVVAMFGVAALRLLPSATRIMAAANTIRFYQPSARELAAEFGLMRRYALAHSARPLNVPDSAREPLASLELENLVFSYPGSAEPAVRGVSLSVAPGKMTALMGRSGSGKTTLSDLLTGLLKPDAGAIRLNGRTMDARQESWHGMLGLVPQEIFLLDDTVRRNVAFGLGDSVIDDKRVWEALRLAQIEDRVRVMPEGLDTRLGERGATLSGGERQRLGIARALYDNPEVLVLDEATSALDPATEESVMDTLTALAGTKTMVVISHRLATVARCDRVYLMDAGRIVDAGSFDEVMARHPDFRVPDPADER